ncbi:hypothetical protein L596_011141 [Steinernema carpocapsae]|uniref:CNH domain-containing protein n=1 Tax=Steinernema carpocapsae TaxID=34508 RepID=A0A4U5NTG8_STECR|nr:hypothetical protein L596_011141 [Steinernema carpocapsae]
MKQLDKNSILVAFPRQVVVTNLDGLLKSSRMSSASFNFPFQIESVLPLSDSFIAFHRHGIEGRAFIDDSVTQELNDRNRTYQLMGFDKLVALRSHPITKSTENNDICILSGHVAS